jgi:hypothetical protein
MSKRAADIAGADKGDLLAGQMSLPEHALGGRSYILAAGTEAP